MAIAEVSGLWVCKILYRGGGYKKKTCLHSLVVLWIVPQVFVCIQLQDFIK